MNLCVDNEEDGGSIPLQEKRAWLGLGTTAAVYGLFLAEILATPAGDLSLGRFVILFTIAITIQSVILAVGNSIFAARNLEETKAPLDERDRLVARRSTMVAYVALMAIVFLLGFALPYYGAAGWQITLAAIMAMVVADLVRHAAIIVNYRRNG